MKIVDFKEGVNANTRTPATSAWSALFWGKIIFKRKAPS
jgi:hypothetical protein